MQKNNDKKNIKNFLISYIKSKNKNVTSNQLETILNEYSNINIDNLSQQSTLTPSELSPENIYRRDILISFLTFTENYDIINAFLYILKKKLSEQEFKNLLDEALTYYMFNVDKAIKNYPLYNNNNNIYYEGLIISQKLNNSELHITESNIKILDFIYKISILLLHCKSLNLNLLYEYKQNKMLGSEKKNLYFIKLLVKYIKYMNKYLLDDDIKQILYILNKISERTITNYNFPNKSGSFLRFSDSYKDKLKKFMTKYKNNLTNNFIKNYETELLNIKSDVIKNYLKNQLQITLIM
jgi:hypothetical protein